jgi:hypothetical protein
VKRRFLIALALVVALAALPVAVYAYDSAHEQHIAAGIEVAGVPIGGLTASEAQGRLRRDLAAPLRRDITVRAAGKRLVLRASESRPRIDPDLVIARALRRSRAGNAWERTLRDLTGDEMALRLRAPVGYSRRAVTRLVERAAQEIDRRPRDAGVRASARGLRVVRALNGRRLDRRRLRHALAMALRDPTRSATVVAAARNVRPAVPTSRVEQRYPHYLVVDRDNFKLKYYRQLRMARTYDIALGQVGFETPTGLYHIQNKAIDPAWSVPNKPWAGALAGRVIPPARRTRSRLAGSASTTGRASTGLTTRPRSGHAPRTVACACASPRSSGSTARSRSARRCTSTDESAPVGALVQESSPRDEASKLLLRCLLHLVGQPNSPPLPGGGDTGEPGPIGANGRVCGRAQLSLREPVS